MINKIRKVSTEKDVQELADVIQKWKTTKKNVIDLRDNIEIRISNIQIEKEINVKKINKIWSDFRDDAIDKIGGMTMNERLYLFGLFDLFDNASNRTKEELLYPKLMAEK